MSHHIPGTGGWQPDRGDHRDWTCQHPTVQQRLGLLRRLRNKDERVGTVDWREYCGPVFDQGVLAAGSAHACSGLVQYFERRASGRLIDPSRLFVHTAARRLAGGFASDNGGVPLRDTLRAIVRCGLPPEVLWPYRAEAADVTPDPFAFCYSDGYRDLYYVRLDEPNQTREQTLDRLRQFLRAGFACMLGFPLRSEMNGEADISFPTPTESLHGGQAVMIVGFDDRRRIRSDKGSLLIRNSWGEQWGDAGYGWLPYAYVREQLAVDIWTVFKPSWLESGEFFRPW